ncbi:hypothetical protein HK098_007533, partial [Nowakowskiella sp. JEL0407]
MQEQLQKLVAELLPHNTTTTHFPPKLFTKVVSCYSEPQREYHTVSHVIDLLDNFKLYVLDGGTVNWREGVLFAILFHDIVYNPLIDNNEDESIKVFKEYCHSESPDLDSTNIQWISYMIACTKKHAILPVIEYSDKLAHVDVLKLEFDTKLFLDLDLGVLGKSRE